MGIAYGYSLPYLAQKADYFVSGVAKTGKAGVYFVDFNCFENPDATVYFSYSPRIGYFEFNSHEKWMSGTRVDYFDADIFYINLGITANINFCKAITDKVSVRASAGAGLAADLNTKQLVPAPVDGTVICSARIGFMFWHRVTFGLRYDHAFHSYSEAVNYREPPGFYSGNKYGYHNLMLELKFFLGKSCYQSNKFW